MKKVIAIIENSILIILAFSMLFFWTKYMRLQFSDGQTESIAKVQSDYWIFADETRALTEITPDTSFFTPSSVSVVIDGQGYSTSFNTALTKELFSSSMTALSEVFSQNYISKKSTSEIWDSTLSKNDFVLIDYYTDIPEYVICSIAKNKNEIPQGDVFNIKSLILYTNDDNKLVALSKDTNGNVYSVSPEKNNNSGLIYDFHSSNISAYTVNSGFTEFTFNDTDFYSSKGVSLPKEYKTYSSVLSFDTVTASSKTSGISEIISYEPETTEPFIRNDTISMIFDVFDINADIVGFYTDTKDKVTFVDKDFRLEISDNGDLIYSLTKNSAPRILISDILSSTRTQFFAYERLFAACEFVRRLCGDNTDIRFLSSKIENGNFIYDFGFFYNNTALSNLGIELIFDYSGLVSCKANMVEINISAESTVISPGGISADISQSAAIIAEKNNLNGKNNYCDFAPVYVINCLDTPFYPVWQITNKAVKK